MNCKPGDMAVIVKSDANVGRLVEVVEFVGVDPVFGGRVWYSDGPCWLVRSIGTPLQAANFWPALVMVAPIEDSRLRPFRPGDLEDETPTVRELEAA